MANRDSRLQDLLNTTKDYVKKEKTRIENEVKVLEDILSGRTGGAGAQKSGQAKIAAVAQNDLATYLKEG